SAIAPAGPHLQSLETVWARTDIGAGAVRLSCAAHTRRAGQRMGLLERESDWRRTAPADFGRARHLEPVSAAGRAADARPPLYARGGSGRPRAGRDAGARLLAASFRRRPARRRTYAPHRRTALPGRRRLATALPPRAESGSVGTAELRCRGA